MGFAGLLDFCWGSSVKQKNEIDFAKLIQDQNQFNANLQEERRQFNAEILTKLNELELKFKTELVDEVPKLEGE